MLIFIGKKVLMHSAKFSSFHPLSVLELEVLQLHQCSYSSSSASTESLKSRSRNVNQPSFSANYLIKNFGYSEEKALRSSKHVKFRSSKNPDSVVAFLKKHGFSDLQISRLVRKFPAILNLKPESNLMPKMKFFQSLGISNHEVAKILTSGRNLLASGLDSQISPSFTYIKNLLKSHKDAVDTFKRFPGILQFNLQQTVPFNVESLRKASVPDDKILHCLKNHPRFFMIPPDKFKNSVKLIQEMRFNPLSTTFITGIYVTRTLTSLNWEKKIEAYKRWGYSESQVLAAFKIFPWVMTVSEDKIDRLMDLVINKMGCDRFLLLGSPYMISLSFEKTILPRSSVFQILKSKGLIPQDDSFIRFLRYSKQSFLEKFILRYAEETPELLKLFPQKLDHPK